MLKLTQIVGASSDPGIAERLHHLEHRHAVETIRLSQEDVQRHRMRVQTDAGTECVIALDRTAHLYNGAVMLLDGSRAVVVRLNETEWLDLRASDAAAALQLGYFAGNMHWTVRFDGPVLRIALQGPLQHYLERLEPMLSGGKAARVADA